MIDFTYIFFYSQMNNFYRICTQTFVDYKLILDQILFFLFFCKENETKDSHASMFVLFPNHTTSSGTFIEFNNPMTCASLIDRSPFFSSLLFSSLLFSRSYIHIWMGHHPFVEFFFFFFPFTCTSHQIENEKKKMFNCIDIRWVKIIIVSRRISIEWNERMIVLSQQILDYANGLFIFYLSYFVFIKF